MKVHILGKGDISLSQSDFVAQGGQASVYKKDGLAYKIYTDPKDSIPDAKFKALGSITDPNVIKPEDIILDHKTNDPIGYTMKFVDDTFSLCQIFTKSFRDRFSINNDSIVGLVERLRIHITNIHKAGAIIVDLNELNILIDKSIKDLYMIDVDSYQVPGFPAKVIMPSVRDWSLKPSEFSVLSDWFSYAVLSFQMFIGIHPFKGKHKESESIAPESRLEHRMRHNISVFDSSVSIPKVCYPFDVIPSSFKHWLKAVLQDGKRSSPPDLYGKSTAVFTTSAINVTTKGLTIMETASFSGEIIDYIEQADRSIAITTDGIFLDKKRLSTKFVGQLFASFSPKFNRPVILNKNDIVSLIDLDSNKSSTIDVTINTISKSGNRLYAKVGTKIIELGLYDMPSSILPTVSHVVADVMEFASQLYEGVVIQNMIGSIFISLFPKSHVGYQIQVPELDKYKILEAKFDNGILMVVGSINGQYNRLVFRFSDDYSSYDIRYVNNISPTGLNFVVLHNGICVSITEEEKLEVFSNRKDSPGLKIISDPAIGNDMKLFLIGGRVGFARGSKLYQMTLS